jgi:hypothetical protein
MMRAVRAGAIAVAALLLAGCGGAGRVRQLTPPPGYTPPTRTSAPANHSGRAALLWAVGDGDATPNAAALARRIAASHPQRFLYLGDVYPRGTGSDFARNYTPTYGRLAAITAPTPGNHDGGRGYFAYWHRPPYYSFRAGGWQVLSLNSEIAHGTRSAQLRWLRGRLRSGGDCRLAFWHRPRYSAGTVHGDQPDVAPFWRALRGRARVVLNGHDHDSQRLRPVGGITELVAGAGGHGLYPIRRAYRRLGFGDARRYAALRLRLSPGLARFAFVTSSGRVLDRGHVRCTRSPM